MKQLKGSRKELACLAVIFFILLLVETSSLPDRKTSSLPYRSARYGSSKNKGSTSQLMGPVKSRGGGLRGDKDEGGDATLGDEKRKIYTGPNPLHNRTIITAAFNGAVTNLQGLPDNIYFGSVFHSWLL